MNNLFVPLKLGDTYEVVDVYGMISWKGTFEGILEDDNHIEGASLLLFKIHRDPDSKSYQWAGVSIESFPSEKGVGIGFRAYWYGNSPKTLKKWNHSSGPDKPKWVRAKG